MSQNYQKQVFTRYFTKLSNEYQISSSILTTSDKDEAIKFLCQSYGPNTDFYKILSITQDNKEYIKQITNDVIHAINTGMTIVLRYIVAQAIVGIANGYDIVINIKMKQENYNHLHVLIHYN